MRVVGFEEDAYAQVIGVFGGRAQAAGGRRVGLLGGLDVEVAAGEDPDVRGTEVVGQVQEGADLGQDGLVVARRGDPCVARQTQELYARSLELGRDVRPFGGAEAGVDRFLGMGAQLHAVIAVGGREPQDVGQGQAGDTEGGERQLHVDGPYPAPPPATPLRHSGVA